MLSYLCCLGKIAETCIVQLFGAFQNESMLNEGLMNSNTAKTEQNVDSNNKCSQVKFETSLYDDSWTYWDHVC